MASAKPKKSSLYTLTDNKTKPLNKFKVISKQTMDELTDYSSPIIEFKPTLSTDRQSKLVDISTGTEPPPPSKDAETATEHRRHVGIQTQSFATAHATVDDTKLAHWLRKVYPILEAELLKGPTPLLSFGLTNASTIWDDTKIQTYQKISLDTQDNAQGLAVWLSLHTNNAPVLVVTAVAQHDDWCEHVDQKMCIFVPKRVQSGNFIVFTEVKSVPLKACLRSLCTNPYNKNIFAGSTLDGDIYVWEYVYSSRDNSTEVKELFKQTSVHSFAVALDWVAENRLITCHANGWMLQWHVGKEMIKEEEQLLKLAANSSNEISAVAALPTSDFVVGTKDGGVYHCWCSNVNAVNKQYKITPLRKHLFMVSTLLRTKIAGHTFVISTDLSGQVYYHDLRTLDEDTDNVIIQIPLPFKNSIACSRDANVIYCPGNDGSLECYSINDGVHSIVRGALRGKGSFIKCSDNGCWIITGLYGDEFQIFSVEA